MTFASGSVRFQFAVITACRSSRNSCDAAIAAPASMDDWRTLTWRGEQFGITSSNPTSFPPTVTVTTFAVGAMPATVGDGLHR